MQTVRVLRRVIEKSKQVNQQRPFASKKVTYPKITLNDMPNPEGDFYTHNNALQRSHTMHLVVGIGSLLLTWAFGLATGMFEAHQDIPEMPEAIDCYKD